MALRRRDDVCARGVPPLLARGARPAGPRAARAPEPAPLRQAHTLDTGLNAQLAAARGTGEAFDGVAELWWDSLDDLLAAFGSEDGQRANAELAEDEARFIDLERSSLFLAEEQEILGGE